MKMDVSTTVMNENASLITVISMQLIVVYGEGYPGPTEFLISAFCFLFAWQAMNAEYQNFLSQFLIAAIGSFSAAYFIAVPAGFISYFILNYLDPDHSFLPYISEYPISARTIKIWPPGNFSHEFSFGELTALILLLPGWLLVKYRIRQSHRERVSIVFVRSRSQSKS